VESSQSFLRVLQGQHGRAWHDIVTLDESWFDSTPAHEWIWLPTDEKVPESDDQTVQSKKLMLPVVSNPNGFHLIDVLPNGCKFNASDDVNNVPGGVSEWVEGQRGGATQRLVVHADNARPHTAVISTSFMEENATTQAGHRQNSPD
jgi:hypothetical protein